MVPVITVGGHTLIGEQYPGIPAVKNKQIYPMNTDLIGRASPRIVDVIEQTAKILHPEEKQVQGSRLKVQGK